MRACSLNDSLSTKTKMSHIRADPSSFQFGKGCDGKIGGREDLTTCRQAFDFSIPIMDPKNGVKKLHGRTDG